MEIALLVLVSVVLLVINLFVAVPVWLAALLIGILAFSVVGDAVNIIYLKRKLRRADRRSKH